MPLWLPQNIQKRVATYILNRLAVFSDLDQQQLDVSLGTQSELALHDVQLNHERFNIPGVFVRHGSIRNLGIKWGVNGVQVSGSGVELTVALSRTGLGKDATEDLTALLTATTADIAQSMMPEEQDKLEGTEENIESGYGMGELSSAVYSRLVDTALSQLVVLMEGLSIHVILDDDVEGCEATLELMVSKSELKTVDGVRRVSNSGVKLYLIEGESKSAQNSDSESESDTDEKEDEANDALMKSAIFSHEEASTMYMSAVSDIAQSLREKRRELLIDCDGFELHFKGIAMNELNVDVGKLKIVVETLPPALNPMLNFASQFTSPNGAPPESVIEPEEPGFSWQTVSVQETVFVFRSVRLICGSVHVNNRYDSILAQIHKVSAADELGTILVQLERESDSQEDLTVKISDEKVLLVVPNRCSFDLKLDHVADIVQSAGQFRGFKFETADGDDGLQRDIEAQTNTFAGKLKSEQVSLNLSMLPVGLEHNNVKIGDISVNINETEYLNLKNIWLALCDTELIKQDSSNVSAPVESQLTVENVQCFVKQSTLEKLMEDLSVFKIDNDVAAKLRKVRLHDKVAMSILVKSVDCRLDTRFGAFDLDVRQIESDILESGRTQVSIGTIHVTRDFSDIDDTVTHVPLIHNANAHMKDRPMIYLDLIEGQMRELKFWNVAVEYHVRLLKLFESSEEAENLADSIATIREKDSKFPIHIIDCVVGLSPISLPSRGQLVVRDAYAEFHQHNNAEITLDVTVKKAALLLIDDVMYLDSISGDTPSKRRQGVDQIGSFKQQGYIPVASISSVQAHVTNIHGKFDPKVSIDVTSEVLVLETCADSTQTLLQLFTGLKPLVEQSDDIKYHTEVVPFNVLESVEEGAYADIAHEPKEDEFANADFITDDVPSNLDFVESYYADKASRSQWAGGSSSASSHAQFPEYSRADLLLDQDLDILAANTRGVELNSSAQRRAAVFEHRAHSHDLQLNFAEDHFGKQDSVSEGSESTDTESSSATPKKHPPVPPVRLRLNDTKVVWNLHDGYDWAHTRDTITKAVKQVESQAGKEQTREQVPPDEDKEIVHDMLFNSIYIGMPSDQDPSELRQAINRELNDDASETASVALSRTSTSSTSDLSRPQNLKLKRSRKHKMRIELRGIDAEVLLFASVDDTVSGAEVSGEEGQLLNRVDVKVYDFEIFDNVPTSTWNKFVSYMRSAGERESDATMLHLIMDTVKPVPDVATSEVIINVNLLPLRLHVDQDTLDFLTRFFEFKDGRFADAPEEEEILFIQKFDVRAVRIKLDYKPKKVDYKGLKSGHVTEFMNFFILDEADMVLKRIVLYGVPGFPRLAQTLHSIWMPDIRSTQLGDVLSGIAPVRSLIRLGAGVKDLVAVPVREYRKDGRLVRSIQKGAVTFAKSTTNELVRFGAKLAAGTQTLLESAEHAMGGTGAAARANTTQRPQRSKRVSPYSDDVNAFEDSDDDYDASMGYESVHHEEGTVDEHGRQVSLYANQPRGINQGLHVAYDSLGRNLNIARDAVGNIGTQATDNGRGNAQDAARAVARAAPIALIRPIIGATEAVSKTLLGVTNQMDPDQLANVEDKYKHDGRDDHESSE